MQTLKKALVKWGYFRLVDDADTADLIIVVSGVLFIERVTKMERIRESLAIFVAGGTPCADTTMLWAASEIGPALGQSDRRAS